jgi:predicted nuclease with TOPRIM domain
MADLNKEAAKEQRDIEKKSKLDALEEEQTRAEEARTARLDAISGEYTKLDEKQKSLLKNIGDYAALTAGKLEDATAKVKALIDAVTNYNGAAQSKWPSGAGQAIAKATYILNQTNNNSIYDKLSAGIFGSIITSNIKWPSSP